VSRSSERLNYDRLYQEALSDPKLKRTAVELEAALSNAREAREVVFDLFQDLDGFSLDDYKPFSDISSGMDRLVQFLGAAVADRNWRLVKVDASSRRRSRVWPFSASASLCRLRLSRRRSEKWPLCRLKGGRKPDAATWACRAS